MTDETNTSGAQVAPASALAQPAAPPASPPQPDPSWLNDRIAQAKRNAEAEAEARVLKSLGVADVSSAQAAIKAAAEASERNKTDAQRVVELQAQLAAEKERGDVYEDTLKERAASELAALPEDKRQAVLALAGDDVGAQILAIDTLKPTWGAPQSAPPAAPPPAPANSAPPRDAPPPTPGGAPDPYQVYVALREKNPFAAAEYRRQHPLAIAEGQLKQSS